MKVINASSVKASSEIMRVKKDNIILRGWTWNYSPFIEWHLNMNLEILMLREGKICDVSSLREICKILWRHNNCSFFQIFSELNFYDSSIIIVSKYYVIVERGAFPSIIITPILFPPLQQVQIVGLLLIYDECGENIFIFSTRKRTRSTLFYWPTQYRSW